MGYSFRLTARVLLYAPSHRQDSTYHGLCYTSRGALAWTRKRSMGPHHGGSIRRLITPWANALTTELHLAPGWNEKYLNGSTMKDRSDDPSHHEWTLLPRSYISLLALKEYDSRTIIARFMTYHDYWFDEHTFHVKEHRKKMPADKFITDGCYCNSSVSIHLVEGRKEMFYLMQSTHFI